MLEEQSVKRNDDTHVRQLSRTSQAEPERLDLGKLELLRRWSQYAAAVVLVVFVVLIGLSWLQLRRINNEVHAADEKLNAKKREIDELVIAADNLKKEISALDKQNGKLTAANTTLNEVTDSLAKQAPDQVKQALEASIATTKDPNQLPPRIYIQIADKTEFTRATEAGRELQKRGYIIPPIEIVGSDRIPDRSQLRYYANDSFAPADSTDILSTLEGLGIHLEAKSMNNRSAPPRPRHYELWFGKNF